MHTYFAPGAPADTKDETRSTSALPGTLGRAVDDVISPQETILFELACLNGEGFTCTNERILITKAARGLSRARQVHAFPYGQATEIDHVIGKKTIRIQISMNGYDTPDATPATVDRQMPDLNTAGNICHLDITQKAVFEGYMTHLEAALTSDDPDAALAGLVVDEWLATFTN